MKFISQVMNTGVQLQCVRSKLSPGCVPPTSVCVFVCVYVCGCMSACRGPNVWITVLTDVIPV